MRSAANTEARHASPGGPPHCRNATEVVGPATGDPMCLRGEVLRDSAEMVDPGAALALSRQAEQGTGHAKDALRLFEKLEPTDVVVAGIFELAEAHPAKLLKTRSNGLLDGDHRTEVENGFDLP